MTQDNEWAQRLTAVIAGQLKAIRQERGMSAQQLADATVNLGHPVPRSVIANLENGRRDSIGIPEVLVLARALDVPPVTLLFPLGRRSDVEVLPGTSVGTWTAVRWFTGEGGTPRASDGAEVSEPYSGVRADPPVAMFREDDALRDSYLVARGWLLHAPESSPGVVEQARRELIAAANRWSRHRRRMRDLGLEPGRLPPEIWPADVIETVDGPASREVGN
ncbi:helix-turn-helix domain-containing protein [Geodermatophilus sp. SYSU D00700]